MHFKQKFWKFNINNNFSFPLKLNCLISSHNLKEFYLYRETRELRLHSEQVQWFCHILLTWIEAPQSCTDTGGQSQDQNLYLDPTYKLDMSKKDIYQSIITCWNSFHSLTTPEPDIPKSAHDAKIKYSFWDLKDIMKEINDGLKVEGRRSHGVYTLWRFCVADSSLRVVCINSPIPHVLGILALSLDLQICHPGIESKSETWNWV